MRVQPPNPEHLLQLAVPDRDGTDGLLEADEIAKKVDVWRHGSSCRTCQDYAVCGPYGAVMQGERVPVPGEPA